MSKMNDKLIEPMLEGYFSIHRDGVLILEDKNMVVDNASTLLRDLMYGDDEARISKLVLGDLNLTKDDNLKDIPEPSKSDTSLVNQIHELPITKRKITKDGFPAIEYSATLESYDLTPNPGDRVLLTEYGLSSPLGLFSKKNKAGIYKDSEVSFRFTWIILFRNRSNTL